MAGFAAFAGPLTRGAAECMPADEKAVSGTAMLKRVVTSTDPQVVEVRTSWGLPHASANEVSYVTDGATCRRAAAAYAAALSPQVPAVAASGWVRVWKVGSAYVVQDTAQTRNDLILTMTLSRRFEVLAQYAY